MLQKKSKEFLDSISRIKKIAHAQRKTKDFHPGMLMTMKIIFNELPKYLQTNRKSYEGTILGCVIKDIYLLKESHLGALQYSA